MMKCADSIAVCAGFHTTVLPIIAGAVGRLPPMAVKLNGVTAKTKPSSGRASSWFHMPGGEYGCSAAMRSAKCTLQRQKSIELAGGVDLGLVRRLRLAEHRRGVEDRAVLAWPAARRRAGRSRAARGSASPPTTPARRARRRSRACTSSAPAWRDLGDHLLVRVRRAHLRRCRRALASLAADEQRDLDRRLGHRLERALERLLLRRARAVAEDRLVVRLRDLRDGIQHGGKISVIFPRTTMARSTRTAPRSAPRRRALTLALRGRRRARLRRRVGGGRAVRLRRARAVALAQVSPAARLLLPRRPLRRLPHAHRRQAQRARVPDAGAATACASSGRTRFPSGAFDVLGAVDFFFPHGMDHHTLMTSPRALNAVLQQGRAPARRPRQAARRAATAGGAAAAARASTSTSWSSAAGRPGSAAATGARARGKQTLLVDEQDRAGGSLLAHPRTACARPTRRWRRRSRPASRCCSRRRRSAWYPEDAPTAGASRACSRCTRPRACSRSRAARYVYATGGYDQNALFADNDRPGVLPARAVGRLLVRFGVAGGAAGGRRRRAVRARARRGARRAPAPRSRASTASTSRSWPRTATRWVRARRDDDERKKIECDLVAVAALPAPASELPRQHGVAGRASSDARRLRLRRRRRRAHRRRRTCSRAATSPASAASRRRVAARAAAARSSPASRRRRGQRA